MLTLELSAVTKRHTPDRETLAPIDLSVDAGEFVVLVGPSGCGKSTLLRMIAGLDRPTSGDVFMNGARVTDLPPGERDVAMVFQNYALYPHMTVAENVAFPLRMRRVPRHERETRVRDAAASLGLGPLLSRKPSELSGGQKQRVALARAVVREPSVFLFDEPLSALDPALRASVRSDLRALHRRLGRATVYVTHDQSEAMSLGTSLVVLRDGRVEQTGVPIDVYDDPKSAFVASFLGSPPMNLLPCVVTDDGVRIGGSRPVPCPPGWPSGEATLGVRPEAVRMDAAGGGPEATVTSIERTGGETVTTCDLGGSAVTARAAAAPEIGDGDKVFLSFGEGSLCLFSRADGRRIG